MPTDRRDGLAGGGQAKYCRGQAAGNEGGEANLFHCRLCFPSMLGRADRLLYRTGPTLVPQAHQERVIKSNEWF